MRRLEAGTRRSRRRSSSCPPCTRRRPSPCAHSPSWRSRRATARQSVSTQRIRRAKCRAWWTRPCTARRGCTPRPRRRTARRRRRWPSWCPRGRAWRACSASRARCPRGRALVTLVCAAPAARRAHATAVRCRNPLCRSDRCPLPQPLSAADGQTRMSAGSQAATAVRAAAVPHTHGRTLPISLAQRSALVEF